jgi:myo-inositol 2-dehydrogenase / D-chiro-inositol 1-dehydrogenase
MQHFADHVPNDQPPLATGEAAKAVLEIIFAAYESARTGCKVPLPFTPPSWAHRPIHCWKPWLSPDCPPELRDEGG